MRLVFPLSDGRPQLAAQLVEGGLRTECVMFQTTKPQANPSKRHDCLVDGSAVGFGVWSITPSVSVYKFILGGHGVRST